jgi:hypothetical protein
LRPTGTHPHTNETRNISTTLGKIIFYYRGSNQFKSFCYLTWTGRQGVPRLLLRIHHNNFIS